MTTLIISVGRYLIAGAILATIAFRATRAGPLGKYGLVWPDVLQYVAYALAVALVGVIAQHVLTRAGVIPVGTAAPRLGVIDLMIAVLVLGTMSAVFLVGMR